VVFLTEAPWLLSGVLADQGSMGGCGTTEMLFLVTNSITEIATYHQMAAMTVIMIIMLIITNTIGYGGVQIFGAKT
jgi:hypothetical protein